MSTDNNADDKVNNNAPGDNEEGDEKTQLIVKKRVDKLNQKHAQDKQELSDSFNSTIQALNEKIDAMIQSQVKVPSDPSKDDGANNEASKSESEPAKEDPNKYITVEQFEHAMSVQPKIKKANETIKKGFEADKEFAELVKTSTNYIPPDITNEIASRGDESLPLLKKALQDEDFHTLLKANFNNDDWVKRKIALLNKADEPKSDGYNPPADLKTGANASSSNDAKRDRVRKSLGG